MLTLSELRTAPTTLNLSIVNKKIQAEEVAILELVTEEEEVAKEGCYLKLLSPNNGKNALPIAAKQIRFMLKIYRELVDAEAIGSMHKKIKDTKILVGTFGGIGLLLIILCVCKLIKHCRRPVRE